MKEEDRGRERGFKRANAEGKQQSAGGAADKTGMSEGAGGEGGVFERKDGSWCSIRLCCCRPAGANCCCRTFLRSVGCGVQIVREG